MEDSLILTPVHAGGARIVDRGRDGQRAAGIPTGGAADPEARRAALDLLGLPDHAPCLELPLMGGVWLLSGRGQIVLTGADMNWRLDGKPITRYSVLYLEGDHLLAGRQAINGCRGYLAVCGSWSSTNTGLTLPVIRGSREAGLPGTVNLRRDEPLEIKSSGECPFRNDLSTTYPDRVMLTAHPGPEFRLLTTAQRAAVFGTIYTIDRSSDRQGLRLRADTPLDVYLPSQLSSPVLPGTVQLSPAGPILLGPDAQTIGGYPRILQVDKWQPAFQLRPAQQLRFRPHRSGPGGVPR
jgi:allophanate hydrolase subunit 2